MIKAYDLRTQRVPHPMGIAGQSGPDFSWKLCSDETDQYQRAYRLIAASVPEKLADGTADFYDSGRVESDRTLDVSWSIGMPAPFSRVWWTVTVWDQDDHSYTAEPVWFETGPGPEMFNGKTIFAGEAADQPYTKTSFATTAPALDMPAFPAEGMGDIGPGAPPPEDGPGGPPPEGGDFPMPGAPKAKPEYYFRHTFGLKEKPVRARLYLTASGPCLVRLNGNPAGEWLNDPSPNACSLRSLYTAYDITDGLCEGPNAVAISCSAANITAILYVVYTDGSSVVISTDEAWRWEEGPTQLIGTGEVYDANAEISGWDLPDYDDSAWNYAQSGPDPLIELYPNQDYTQRVVWSEHPSALEPTEWGTLRTKASRITAGRIRVTIPAGIPAGTEICFYMAEKELRNGEIIRGTDPLGNPEEGGSDCFTYICSGKEDGKTAWAPRYSFSGIGWLEVIGWPEDTPISPELITFEAVLNDVPHISEMQSSEPMFTKLHQMLIDTIQNNFHGVLTTCPPYEKGPADGDTSVTLPAFLWNMDCLPIVRRLDDDFAATIRTRISYTEEDLKQNKVAPGMIRTVPEWSSMLVHNCRNLIDMLGYRKELSEFWPEFERYFGNEIAELHYSDYLVDSFFGGDWNSPDGNGAPEGGTLSGTCYEYYSLVTMADLADESGHPEAAARFRAEAEKTRSSINEKCFDAEASEYHTARATYYPAWGPPPWDGKGKPPLPVGYRQTSNLLPVTFGIIPEDAEKAAVERLSKKIAENGNHLNTGFVGAKYLLTTLSDKGYLEQAYEIASQHTYPSWGWWIDQGATTCWEQWGTFSRSYDHYFLAAGPEDWFRETLAGIRDEKDGYKTFTVAPQIPEKLQYFGMASETARGRVSSYWEKSADGLTLKLEIPVGSSAKVVLPAGYTREIMINDVPSEQQIFTLHSGTYICKLKG